MQRLVSTTFLGAAILALGAFGGPRASAAPAPSTYTNVEKAIQTVTDAWSNPDRPKDPNAPGWGVFFDAIRAQLKEYSDAQTPADRLPPLNLLYQMSTAMATVDWAPAQTIREELRSWLRPRVRLAWAERHLNERLANLPPTDDPAVKANRAKWASFVAKDLGDALSKYQTAPTVGRKREGLKEIHAALESLTERNATQPWQPAAELQEAVNGLFNQPNLDVTADLSVVQPFFDQNLVNDGPIFFKGYWSYVTAGPKTGFGLLPSDQGIAFYNSQALQSTTPITDFQQQIAADPQGRRAANMYHFSATSLDWAEQTIYALISPEGLSLTPASAHNVNLQVGSAKIQGLRPHLTRAIAGLIGFNQARINNEVYQNALPEIQARVPQEAQELAQIEIAKELAQRNAAIQQYLIGNDILAYRDILIAGLSLRSRPDAVYVGGLFQARGGDARRGADSPQPPQFAAPEAGLTADVHVGSVLTSAVDSLFRRPDVQDVQNLMIVTRDIPPGTPPSEGVTVTKNVDYPTFLKAAEEARAANNPKVQAIRIRRPSQPPEFAADARGFLVAIVKDVEIDAPAPDPNSQAGSAVGAAAKVLRIKIPQTEIALSYQVEPRAADSYHVTAKIEDVTVPPTSQVLAINDSEAEARPLNRFSGALVITALIAKLRSQPIDTDVPNVRLPGLAIQSVSPVDPSGWMRIHLVRTAEPMPAPDVFEPPIGADPDAQPAAAPTTAPSAAAAPAQYQVPVQYQAPVQYQVPVQAVVATQHP